MLSTQSSRLLVWTTPVSSRSSRWSRWFKKSAVRSCAGFRPSPGTTPSKWAAADPPIPAVDHRTLGASLDLFSNSAYSPGSPLYHPSGAHVFHKLQAFLRAQYAGFGFREVVTPIIYKQSLWEISGHWENYKDDMFEVTGRGASGGTEGSQIGEDEKFGLKPMNCPGHCLLFKSKKRSFRDLPIRYADFGPLHRNEISGALSGLTRVRRFHQDDGHIFCRPGQVEEEIAQTLQFVELVYRTFGLGPLRLVLSTRPKDHFIGEPEDWDRAEEQLKSALERTGGTWGIREGDGAFYGPKIDVILKDSDGREHQTATIQLDFQLPRRFGLTYQAPAPKLEAKGLSTTDPDLLGVAGDVTPVIIHRAVFGSLERFMALLIEHYKGRWPFWLSPRQMVIVTIGEEQATVDFSRRVAACLSGSGESNMSRPRPLDEPRLTVDLDLSARSLSKKIAEAKSKHYNLICVVGRREASAGTLAVDFTGQPQRDRVFERCRALIKDAQPGGAHLSMEQLGELAKWMCYEYL
jgi:threonyl-tRNA synthetase